MSLMLEAVTSENWRGVVAVEPEPSQGAFVASVSHYLCLCHYEQVWHPLAVSADGEIVGHVMWAFDTSEGSHWIGGLVIDSSHQGKGFGRATVTALMRLLEHSEGASSFALSYLPTNHRARTLYLSMGFVETNENAGDEAVARIAGKSGTKTGG